VGPLGEPLACVRQHGLELDPAERRGILGMAGEIPVEHGLRDRAQEEAVLGREEVDGRPHRDDPHDAPPGEELAQVVGPEALEPSPEGEVGVPRHLRLEADEVADCVERGQVRALEEELPRERRTVEGSERQTVGAQGAIMPSRLITGFAAAGLAPGEMAL
jgi:hypothetical protein